jgi:hypothetical protein
MRARTCGTCRYRVSEPFDHCRATPPIASPQGGLHPIVMLDGWCFSHSYSLWRVVKRVFGRLKANLPTEK